MNDDGAVASFPAWGFSGGLVPKFLSKQTYAL
jgi:hypothetical protein